MARTLSVLSLACLALLLLASLPAVLAGRDFYKILGLSRNANDRQIKKAYRQLSKLHHPDKARDDPDASKKFQDLGAAYETLSDPEKRRVYDQGGEEALKQAQGGGGGGRDPFDLFSSFFGGGGHRHGHDAQERRGADVHLDLPVTLEDLYKGRSFEVQVRQAQLCPHCRGSGAKSESDVHKCHACQGRGVQVKVVSLGPGFMQQVQQPCDVCQGKGKVIRSKCPVCSGAKTVRGTKVLDVTVEAGMKDGERIEFEHAADEHPDHAAGHVVFTLRTAAHERFRREGEHLHVTQVITLKESLLGFDRTLSHLDGHQVSLRSSGVTSHGDVVRLVGEGMPRHQTSSQKGDLFVRYEVQFPKALTQQQRDALDKILTK